MTEAKRIVVIGGGITGLAAAHAALGRARELGRAVDVTVIEGTPRFGGSLVTARSGGFLLDGGPDSWVATKPQASALARELGLGGGLIGTIPANWAIDSSASPPRRTRTSRSPSSPAGGSDARRPIASSPLCSAGSRPETRAISP